MQRKNSFMNKANGLLIIGTLTLFSCATTQKAELSSQNPKEAISEVEEIRVNSLNSQIDLLANGPFKKGEHDLNSAIENLRDGDDKSDVLEELSQSKAYFIQAKTVANGRTASPKRILSARKATLNNGVRESTKLTEKLGELDETLREKTDNFTQTLSVEDFSKIEKDYLDLEVQSVQNANLMAFRDILKDAEDNEAPDLAPNTYTRAKTDLRAAENMIQQSPRNSENYEESVFEANKSAKLLSDVMSKLNGVAKGASEKAALKLVLQERKLGLLSEEVNNLQGSLNRSEDNLSDVSDKLQLKTGEALSSENKVLFQKSMAGVRDNFSNDEAVVYQQGNNLIIRLKQIDFKLGSAMIPSKSMGLLSKVNSIIETMHPGEVIVQGHTDSLGKNASNQALSVKRSESVARYFKSLNANYKITSEGFGESDPIANNETKAGRSMNRRVDIVISTNNPG